MPPIRFPRLSKARSIPIRLLARLLPAAIILAAAVHAYAYEGIPFRVNLDRRAADAREPAKADFTDCAQGQYACQALAFQRVMADEKIVLPRGKALESLRFLSLQGIRAQSGDPILTLALYSVPEGDSIYADLDNDEDLGDDGPAHFWPKGDSCATIGRSGDMAPVSLCRPALCGPALGRPRPDAMAWRGKCESLKTSITWALCDEPPYRIRTLDLALGTLRPGGISRAIGFCDADGDGKIRAGMGDRLVVDWDGDGKVEKSLEADGIALPEPGTAPKFSVDSVSYEVSGWDGAGSWLDLRRLDAYDPAAPAFKAVEGRKAPDLRFVNMDGDTVKLSDFRGKKVMIQFWSTLCKPCLDRIAAIRDFHKAFGNKNWQIISLTTDTDLGAVQQAVIKYHMDWMVGMAGPEARRYYASRPLPLNVKIDERGLLEKRDLILGPRAF